jgi:protein arginine kinase activator
MQICPLTNQPCNCKTIYHITEIQDNGSLKTLDLCHLCGPDYIAKTEPKPIESKVVNDPLISVLDVLFSTATVEILKFLEPNDPIEAKKENEKQCVSCGITLGDMKKGSHLGCPKCYDSFRDEIELIAESYHGSLYHTGKRPKVHRYSTEEKLKLLKLKLASAIEYERFEEVNQLKKEIDELTRDVAS